jgi:hypothetical protein
MKPNKFSNEQLGSNPSFATKEKKKHTVVSLGQSCCSPRQAF